MGSSPIPDQDMAEERKLLLARIDVALTAKTPNRLKAKELEQLLAQAQKLLQLCPSTSCAFCEHMPRSAAGKEQETTTGD